SDYFQQRFGKKIIRQYRTRASNVSLERGHDVTFTEFLTYVTGLDRGEHKRDFNEHWRPIYDLCLPCLVDFDVIGKMETLVEDAQLVLWKANVYDYVKFPKREHTYTDHMPSTDLVQQYYSNISQSLMNDLATVYAQDMKLFNYSKKL